MATPVYVLTINGVTVRPLRLGFEIREVANGRNRMTLSLYSATGAPPIALFDTVQLTEDGVTIFGGHVDAPTEAGAGGLPITPTITTVSVVDFNQLAERRAVNLTFPAGTLKSQLLVLLGTFGDVTLDPTQPDGPAMPEWAAVYWRADDVLNQLTTLSGGYLWNVSYTRVLAMRAPTATLAPVAITDANRVAIGDVSVTPSTEQYANRVQLLYGGDGVGPTDDRHTGNGVTASFPVRNLHVSNVGYVTNNGVNETLGAGATWTLSPDAWTLTRTAGAPAVGALIVFTYNALFPTLVSADAPGGIPTPPGLWEVILRAPDVKTYAVAQPMAVQEVAVRSARPRTIVYRTLERGIHPGQSQAITKTARHLSAVATVISEVTIRNATGRDADRIVTAVEGSQFPGTWRDMIKGWSETGGGASSFVSGGGGGGGGGAPIGPGTPGTLAVFTGTNTIGDSILTQSGGVLFGNGGGLTNLNASALASGTVAAARLPQFVGGDVVTAGAGSVNLQLVAGAVGSSDIAAGAIGNVHIAAGAAIDWSKISKVGAVLSDFGGTLAWAQLPTGTGTWTMTLATLTGVVNLGEDLFPTVGYHGAIGALTRKFLAIHAAELWVETLVAQNTMATIGGRVLVAPTNILTVNLSPSDLYIWVKYPNLANGDVIYLEEMGAVEFLLVTSTIVGSDPITGYAYTVTHNLDGSGANTWNAGAAVLNTGTTGKGFIDLYSLSGVLSGSGPTIVGNVRTGTAYNAIAPRWAIGNLNGVAGYGYTSDTYGAAFGNPAGAWLKIDPTYGFRIGHNTTTLAQIDASGNAAFSGTILVGPTPFGAYVTLTAIDSYGGAAIFDAAINCNHSIRAAGGVIADNFLVGLDNNALTGTAGIYANPYGLGVGYKVLSVRRYPDVGAAPQIVLMPGGTSEYGRGVAVNGPLTVGSATRTNASPTLDVVGALGASDGATIANGLRMSSGGIVIDNGHLEAFGSGGHGFQLAPTGGNLGGAYLQWSAGAYQTIEFIGTQIGFVIGPTVAQRIDANGDLIPNADNTRRVGVPTQRFSLIRGVTITPGDLLFENGFAFTEADKVGIDEPGIALVDPTGAVVAFFGATATRGKGLRGGADVDLLRHVRTSAADRARMDAYPDDRVIGYDGARPIYGTRAAVPMPDPATARTNHEWKGIA